MIMATTTATRERESTAREPNHSIERKVAGNWLRVAIWANELESGGTGFTIKPTLRYQDKDGEYHNAKNFREVDLVHFAKMLTDADTWCQQHRQSQRADRNGEATGDEF